MMKKDYACFLWKRIWKRKSNLLVILISVGILGAVLVLNFNMRSEFRDRLESEIESFGEAQLEYAELMLEVPEDSLEYELYQSSIEANKDFQKAYEKLLELYDAKAWDAFYEMYKSVLNEEAQIVMNSKGEEEDAAFDRMLDDKLADIAYITYLDAHDLVYENRGYPMYGLSFLTWISRNVLPILALICTVYILAQLFTMDQHAPINTSELLPMHHRKREWTKLLLGMGIAWFVFLFLLVTTFAFSACLTQEMGMNYPILIQDDVTKIWHALSLLSVLPQWVVLGLLYYLCGSLMVYLLSKVIKQEAALFLGSLCILIGFAFLPSIAGMLMPIAHNLATTYLKLVDVISGTLASDYGNTQITFSSGMLVLGIFLLLELMVIGFLHRKKGR